jgi:hypothetical protein
VRRSKRTTPSVYRVKGEQENPAPQKNMGRKKWFPNDKKLILEYKRYE